MHHTVPALDDVHLEDALTHGTGFGSLEAQVQREADDLVARFGAYGSARLAVLVLAKIAHYDGRLVRATVQSAITRLSRTLPEPTGKRVRPSWIRSPRHPKHAR